jgi:hypothetical protein
VSEGPDSVIRVVILKHCQVQAHRQVFREKPKTPAGTDSFFQKVDLFNQILCRNKPVYLSVSAGPDSVLLQ